MTTYISLLRGINVSGQKLIKMNDLRNLYLNAGLQEVITYLQSGNVVFTHTTSDPKQLEQNIAGEIKKELGFEVPVIVLSLEELRQILDNNPFLKDPEKDQAFWHITFLSSKPENYEPQAIESKKENGEEVFFSDRAVYLYCPNGYGRTKLNNTFLEAKLKVGATTRNWKTCTELLKLALHEV